MIYAHVSPSQQAGKGAYTVANVTKAATFFNFVSVFLEGMDFLRNGICIAMDLGEFGWNHWDISFWSGMGPMWTDVFPMLMKRIAIINPPLILSGLMKLASVFVKKKIMDRISVLDSKDPVILKNHLEIEDDQLSSDFGGKVKYSWELYEQELKAYCKENQDRLTALPPKESKHKEGGKSVETSGVSLSTESKSKSERESSGLKASTKKTLGNIFNTQDSPKEKKEKCESAKSVGAI